MNNVVEGRLTDAPENSHVPGWIRKVLLRGMATKLDDRFPTMADLLEAMSFRNCPVCTRLYIFSK